MKYAKWKGIQRWSYLFYGLTYLHIVLILLKKDEIDILKISIYTAVFGVYTILRVSKYFKVRKEKSIKIASV